MSTVQHAITPLAKVEDKVMQRAHCDDVVLQKKGIDIALEPQTLKCRHKDIAGTLSTGEVPHDGQAAGPLGIDCWNVDSSLLAAGASKTKRALQTQPSALQGLQPGLHNSALCACHVIAVVLITAVRRGALSISAVYDC